MVESGSPPATQEDQGLRSSMRYLHKTHLHNRLKTLALSGIEWRELAFPDVNMHMHVHVNVNVPEAVWSYALMAKFRKHGTNPCQQKLSVY